MAPQLSQGGASSWKRENWSLRTAGENPVSCSLPLCRSTLGRSSRSVSIFLASTFFAAAVEWPLPFDPFAPLEPLAWPLPLVLVTALLDEPAVAPDELSLTLRASEADDSMTLRVWV